MLSLFLLPLHGAFLVVSLAMFAVRIWALVDAAFRPDAAFRAAGKQTKVFWLMALVLCLFFWIVGIIGALVYLLDVRPALRQVGGRSGRSDAPYGRW